MHQVPDDAFERFATQRKKDLQRIARHTGGEHQLADVVHEAWIMAWSLQAADGSPVNLAAGDEIEDTQGAISLIALLMKFVGTSAEKQLTSTGNAP